MTSATPQVSAAAAGSESATQLKGLIEYLAKALVDDPLPVEVAEERDDGGVVFLVKVGKDDLGKVIGKKGRTAKSLRTLLAAAAAKQNIRANMEIVEPDREPPSVQAAGDVASGDVAASDAESADVASADVASADVASADVASADVASADVASAD